MAKYPKFLFLVVLAVLAASSASAQSTAAPVSPGSDTTVGCPGSFLVCWKPYSATNPLPVGPGGVATLTYSGSTSASVAITSGTLVTAGAYTRALQVCTLPTSTTNVWLNAAGAAAVVSTGILVYGGGGCVSFGGLGFPIPTAAITAITDSGSAQTVILAGG